MRDQRSNAGVPSNGTEYKRCSRCRKTKPVTAFYRNPSSICKDCQNRASRFSNEVRRAAIAHLIAAHQAEYQTNLQTERTSRIAVEPGGGSDAA